jgi:uncharacterized membrane protein YbhN (UPF0104 family)
VEERHLEQPSSRPNPLFLVGVVLVVVLLSFFLARNSSLLRESFGVITTLSPYLLMSALLGQVISYAGSGYLVQAAFKLLDTPLSLGRSIVFFNASSTTGVVAGGTAASAASMYWLGRREGLPQHRAITVGLLPDATNFLSMFVVSCFGVLYLFLDHKLAPHLLYMFGVALFLLIIAALLISALISYPTVCEKLLSAPIRIMNRVFKKDIHESAVTRTVSDLKKSFALLIKEWPHVVLGEAINILGDLLTIYVLFLAVGISVPFGLLLVGYGLPHLLGIDSAQALVVVLAYRLLSFWIPLVIGLLSLNRLRQGAERESVSGSLSEVGNP